MTEKKQAQVEQHQKRLDGKLAMERKKKRKSDEVNLRRFPYKEGSHNNQKAKTTVNEEIP